MIYYDCLSSHVDRLRYCETILSAKAILKIINLSQPQTINSYDGFGCHDDVEVVAVTSDYRLGR